MKKITLLFAILFCYITNSNAQIGVTENFNASTTFPTGWTNPNFYGVSATQACQGNSIRKNLYSTQATAVLTTPNYAAASNGTDITFSFDYKIVNWSAATVATPAGWGSSLIQYSIDNGATWTTSYTIDDTNHVVANTCANVLFTISSFDVPSGSDLQFRFNNTWLAGDYYFYIDNISITQVSFTPPNCDAVLTSPANNATNVEPNGNIAWSSATGIATGYNLTVGSFSGGNDILPLTDVGNVNSYALGPLLESTTYYVSIVPYNSNGDAFGCTENSFTTRDPLPVGFTCNNPIIVTLPYATTDDTANYGDIYIEGSPGAGCGSTSGYLGGNDVVYSYTATSDTTIKIVASGLATWVGMFVYGSCADIGVNCQGGGVNGGTTANIALNEFPVINGNTYYIVLSTWPTPQTTAYTLTITENTCVNSTSTYAVVSNCAVAPEFFVDVNITDMGTASSLTISDDQASATQSAFATGVVQFGPYANGTSVIFTVANDQDTNCVFTSTAQTQVACPPANNLCANAIDLALETSPLNGTTVAATNNNSPSCSTGSTAGDVYYSILVPSGSTLTMSQTVNNYDSVVSVFYGDCTNQTAITCFDDPDTTVVTWQNTTGTDQTVYWVNDGYTTGNGTFTLAWSVIACVNATATYAVVSDCANGPQFNVNVNITDMGSATSLTISDDQASATQTAFAIGTYTFGPYANGTSVIFTVTNDQDSSCVITSAAQNQAACPPANDLCGDAIDLVPGVDFASGAISVNNLGATVTAADGTPTGTCGQFNLLTTGKDIWYTVAVPASGSITVETQGNGGILDTAFALYSGTCGALTFIDCSDDEGVDAYSLKALTGITEPTIYVRVWGYSGAAGSFQLSAYDASLSNSTFDTANFVYYPNPVKDVLNLTYNKSISNVEVYNLLGQQVIAKTINTTNSQIDMSNLPSGNYLVKVTADNQTKTLKVIKE